jgi:hypothetical protein
MGSIPARHFVVAVMINMDGVNAQALLRSITELYGMPVPNRR